MCLRTCQISAERWCGIVASAKHVLRVVCERECVRGCVRVLKGI